MKLIHLLITKPVTGKTRELHLFDLDGQGQLKVKVTYKLFNMFVW
jgi:hypothetical protein